MCVLTQEHKLYPKERVQSNQHMHAQTHAHLSAAHTTGTGGQICRHPACACVRAEHQSGAPSRGSQLVSCCSTQCRSKSCERRFRGSSTTARPVTAKGPPPPIISSLQTHSCKRSGSNADPRRNLNGRIPFHCEELWFPSAH